MTGIRIKKILTTTEPGELNNWEVFGVSVSLFAWGTTFAAVLGDMGVGYTVGSVCATLWAYNEIRGRD